MMQKQEIAISILPDGRVEYTIQGVKGSSCERISELLEQLGEVENSERTGEYYEEEQSTYVSVDQS